MAIRSKAVQDTKKLRTEIHHLGNKVGLSIKPSKDILEVFTSPSTGMFYVTFTQANEFTSLCPITKAPDFADIRILYRPNTKCVESKALKLYLHSFRNTGAFGEAITNRIADDLFDVLKPAFLAVVGDFHARGGLQWKTEALRGDCVASHDLSPMDTIQLTKFR